jgi:hypothetical protein
MKKLLLIMAILFLFSVETAYAWWTPYDHINLRGVYMINNTANMSIGTPMWNALFEIAGSVLPKSGLSMNVTSDLFVNETSNRVGINQSNPRSTLEVNGDVMITENNTLYLTQSKKAYISFDGTKMTIKVN